MVRSHGICAGGNTSDKDGKDREPVEIRNPTLIYCAAGNRKHAKIALEEGFEYGARLPGTIYYPPYFADQDWKNPSREKYMMGLQKHRPTKATVLDWERAEQLPEVLNWAEEASQFVQEVVIIPKVHGEIHKIPRRIGRKRVILGYSVPSNYGATTVSPFEFAGWPVHLLGGTPHAQMAFWSKYHHICRIESADGNAHHAAANRFCNVWVPKWSHGKSWYSLDEEFGVPESTLDRPYLAFRLSCIYVKAAWKVTVLTT